MAILYSYPLGVPERTDLIVGSKMSSTDTDDLPITQNYSIGSVLDMITSQVGAQTLKALSLETNEDLSNGLFVFVMFLPRD